MAPERKRDVVAGVESLRLWRRPTTWDEVYEHAARVLALAVKESGFAQRWVLFSGGNDSLVLLHVILKQLEWPIQGVLHCNTGTGVREGGRFLTSDFARETVEGWGVRFEERFPPKSFDEVFIDEPIIDGLPGPGMHNIAFARLKERTIAAFVAEQKRSYWDYMIFPTGVRKDESQRRMGYGGSLVNKNGVQMWCNPLYYASSRMMAAYRAEHGLPVNPVSEHLHMSGECLCGSFASPGELDEISFFYPETGAWLREREQRARAAGLTYWAWGTEREDMGVLNAALADGRITEADLWPSMDLCRSCDTRRQAIDKARGRISLFDEEVGA